ncbi:MAG: hypothetical protein HUU32_16095 [Calditrichaceae bacterium]|nr:hypothetical protein [Calditrichia bacterium]NUQ42910.1 hypothetical protein [Calditrichaceae bacterium]
MSFEELFEHLINPASPRYEWAWKEFMRRYGKVIREAIKWRCYRWNSRMLRKQIGDVINDIEMRVLEILFKDGFKALRDFRQKDSEEKFIAWLRQISSRAAGRELKDKLLDDIRVSGEDLAQDDEASLDIIKGADDDTRWENFEDWATVYYDEIKKKRGNLERDLHMFMLRAWAEFDPEKIVSFPCFKGMKPHNVEVVVNRVRDIIGKRKNSSLAK